jgi:hypothetical protein
VIASKRARLAELQEIPWRVRTSAQRAELEQLRTELSREQRETADDPSTWLVDESKRPQLDGTDWNDFNNAMCRDEVKALGVKYGLPLIKLAVESLLLKG